MTRISDSMLTRLVDVEQFDKFAEVYFKAFTDIPAAIGRRDADLMTSNPRGEGATTEEESVLFVNRVPKSGFKIVSGTPVSMGDTDEVVINMKDRILDKGSLQIRAVIGVEDAAGLGEHFECELDRAQTPGSR